MLEIYLQEIQKFGRLFHISTHHLIKTLQPKIPENIYTKLGLEDKTIKRISVCPDVDHCLLALGENIVKDGPKVFSVYEPEDYSKIKVLSNKEIVKKNLVPDAKQTLETWILSPAKFKKIAKIRVLKAADKYEVIHVPPVKSNAKMWYWIWEVIEGTI